MSHVCDRCAREYAVEWAVTKEAWERLRGPYDFLCLECAGTIVRANDIALTLTDFRYLSVGGKILLDALPGGERAGRLSTISERRIALLRRMASEWDARAAERPNDASVDAATAALALTETLDALERTLDAEDSAYANATSVARERDSLLTRLTAARTWSESLQDNLTQHASVLAAVRADLARAEAVVEAARALLDAIAAAEDESCNGCGGADCGCWTCAFSARFGPLRKALDAVDAGRGAR